MQDKPLPVDKKASAELAKRIAALSVLRTSSTASPTLLKKISGKKIEFAQNETGVSGLTISFQNTDAQVQIDRGDEKFNIKAGLQDWKFSQTPLNTLAGPPRGKLPIQVASKYSWANAVTLELTSRFVEESIRSEAWILSFEENGGEIKVHLEIKVFVEFMGIQSRKLEGKIVN